MSKRFKRAKTRRANSLDPPATGKQRAFMGRLGIKFSRDVTLSEASFLIRECLTPKPPPPPKVFIPTIILRRNGATIKVTSHRKPEAEQNYEEFPT